MNVHRNRLKYFIIIIPCTISRIFGVLGFAISTNFKAESSIMSRIYSVAIFIGYFAYFIQEFKSSTEFYNDNYRKSIIYFEFVVYWCVSLSCIFLTIITQNKLLDWVKKILETFKKLDLEQKRLKRLLWFVCGRYAVGFILVITYSQLSFFVRQQPNMTYTAQLLYLALCSNLMVMLLAFSNGVFIIFVFFKELNRELLEIFEESSKNSDIINVSVLINEYKSYLLKEEQKKTVKIKGIQNLSQKHHSYCILAMKLNDCFSLQILLFTALCFIELTYSMYYMIMSRQCTSDLCINVQAATAFALSWMVFYAVQLGGCAVSCQFLKDEANHTALIIHKILNKETEKKIKNLLEIFSLQIHQWKLELTAYGFFTVDNSLLYTMVGSVTSALVILIQFQRYSSSSFSIYYSNFTIGEK